MKKYVLLLPFILFPTALIVIVAIRHRRVA
jgi:hypothetical protein